MAKILVVDDEPEIAELLKIYITNERLETVIATNGQEALSLLNINPDISLMILDIMMPNMDGFEVIKRVRKESNIPILVLSAKSADMDKIQGLVTGADDYVDKTTNPLEIMARVRGLLRRKSGNVVDASPEVLDIGPLTINKDSHEVRTTNSEQKVIPLTALEFGILYTLASKPNHVFSAQELFEKVWKTSSDGSDSKTVMVHLSHLRDKVKEATLEDVVKTVWGVGYKIEAND